MLDNALIRLPQIDYVPSTRDTCPTDRFDTSEEFRHNQNRQSKLKGRTGVFHCFGCNAEIKSTVNLHLMLVNTQLKLKYSEFTLKPNQDSK